MNARLSARVCQRKGERKPWFLPRSPLLLRAWGWLLLGKPPGFPSPPPLVRFADKALCAFPTPSTMGQPR